MECETNKDSKEKVKSNKYFVSYVIWLFLKAIRKTKFHSFRLKIRCFERTLTVLEIKTK